MKTRLIKLMIRASVLATLIGLMSWGAGFAANLNSPNKDRHQNIVETTIYTCLECHFSSGSSKTGSKTYSLTDAGSETEYHHVEYCTVCHDMTGPNCGGYTNLYLIACTISTPNSGDRNVKFTSLTGMNSYADGDNTYNGVCEVCHTLTAYHRNDGSDNTEHFDGSNCTECHPHTSEFSAPYEQFHKTHLTSDKGPKITCTDCHSETDYTIFADGKTLANTTVCDTCHSPNGAFDGVNDPVIGAKHNWVDGVYNADGVTLKSGKEKWCAGCHDDVPAYSFEDSQIITIDNPAATFVGAWNLYGGAGETYYGTDMNWKAAGSGSATATWTPNIAEDGTYSVYAWWSSYKTRATNAKYTINHSGGSDVVQVSQKANGGKWNLLGTYEFVAGTSGSVVLSDDANGEVVADAVRIVRSTVPGALGTYAPNIVGDNSTWGFYVTGHNISCLECHDATKAHIDHVHRTYQVDEANNYAVATPYSQAYRLKDVDGGPAMILPRDGTNPLTNPKDFALCFSCHNKDELLGTIPADLSVPHTNFWDTNSSIGNAHKYHLSINALHFDSDWDGVVDSKGESCVTCHNVHGSPTKAMIRHGELISTPGTTDKVPALNFSYLLPPGVSTATWPVPAGSYYVYAWWSSYSTRATNAQYTVNHDGGSSPFTVNQKVNGGQWNQLGTAQYVFSSGGSVVVSADGANGEVVADAIGLDSNGDGTPDIIIDDNDAQVTYEGDWIVYSGGGESYYGSTMHYNQGFIEDTTASLAESIGGWPHYSWTGVSQNHVCNACHSPSRARFMRTPYLGPKVFQPQASPSPAPPDGTTAVLFTAVIRDPDNAVVSVTIDLSAIDGSSAQAMFDDGTHGDVTSGDGIYSFVTVVPISVVSGNKTITIMATDATSLTGQGQFVLPVFYPGTFIIDNTDAEATFTGSWNTYAGAGETYYGPNMRWKAAGTGSATATWTPNITAAGNYRVYAWWSSYSSRATNATYTINYDGGSQPITVNQKVNGGQWNQLGTGTFSFAPGIGSVVLSDDANGEVVADAILWEPIP
jgi:hypothetical protein